MKLLIFLLLAASLRADLQYTALKVQVTETQPVISDEKREVRGDALVMCFTARHEIITAVYTSKFEMIGFSTYEVTEKVMWVYLYDPKTKTVDFKPDVVTTYKCVNYPSRDLLRLCVAILDDYELWFDTRVPQPPPDPTQKIP